MPVSLSIKNVPDEIVDKLKQRAAQNHRSLQGELLYLLEEAVKLRKITVKELREKVALSGLKTADEATSMIRDIRDGR